jgi:hypothetical protein
MRLAFLVALLTAVPVQAVMPFSWTSTASSLTNTQVVVPDGMIWRVEQISGFHEGGVSSQWPPLITIAEQGSAADRMVYYANPTLIASSSTRSIWTYNQQPDLGYRGTVTISSTELFQGSAPGPVYIPSRFSIIGYLVPTLAGDYSGDGYVDAADYTVLRDEASLWETSDMAAWRANYGAVSTEPAIAVPEPSTLIIAAMMVAVPPGRRCTSQEKTAGEA